MSDREDEYRAWVAEHRDVVEFLGQFRSDEAGFLSSMEYQLEGWTPLTDEQVAEVRKYMD